MTRFLVVNTLLLLSLQPWASLSLGSPSIKEPVVEAIDLASAPISESILDEFVHQGSYGVDVSWPIHHSSVSTNFPWLAHNVDPEHNPVPAEFKDMPMQPLGDRQKSYDGTSKVVYLRYVIYFPTV